MSEPLVLDVGFAVVPIAGERVSGDVVLTTEIEGGRFLAIVADGLGHGVAAWEAASECVAALRGALSGGMAEAFAEAHRALRATRGAVAGAVVVDPAAAIAETAVLGNVTIRTLGIRGSVARSVTAVATPGVLGSSFRRVHIESVALEPGDVIVLHSDGVRSRFEPLRVRASDAQSAAEEIVVREGRAHDDSSCVVVRVLPPAAAVGSRRCPPAEGVGVDIALSSMSDIQVAAMQARDFAISKGASGRHAWEISIAAAELAQNAVKYGVEGVLTLRIDGEWLVLEAVDRGPGFGAAPSSSGLGEGLGAVRRMMDCCDVRSGPLGSRVITRKRIAVA
jgi:negative regulator of sigma-B (phosphoserine phosphatase)